MEPQVRTDDEVIVYTQAWTSDSPTKPGEKPNAQLHSRVFANGVEIKNANGVIVTSRNGEFLTVQINVLPGSVRFVPLDAEEWKNLG